VLSRHEAGIRRGVPLAVAVHLEKSVESDSVAMWQRAGQLEDEVVSLFDESNDKTKLEGDRIVFCHEYRYTFLML
jgi:hypothetical protein